MGDWDVTSETPATPNGVYRYPDGSTITMNMDPNETSPAEVRRALAAEGVNRGGQPLRVGEWEVATERPAAGTPNASPHAAGEWGVVSSERASTPSRQPPDTTGMLFGTQAAIDAQPRMAPIAAPPTLASIAHAPQWQDSTNKNIGPALHAVADLAHGGASEIGSAGAGLLRLAGAAESVNPYVQAMEAAGLVPDHQQDTLFGAEDSLKDASDASYAKASARSPTAAKIGAFGGGLASFLAQPEAEGVELPSALENVIAKVTSNPKAQAFLAQEATRAAANTPRGFVTAAAPAAATAGTSQQTGVPLSQAAEREAAQTAGGTLQAVLPASIPASLPVRMAAGLVTQQAAQKAQQFAEHMIAPDQVEAPTATVDPSDTATWIGPMFAALGGHGADPISEVPDSMLRRTMDNPRASDAQRMSAAMELAQRSGVKTGTPLQTDKTVAGEPMPALPRGATIPPGATTETPHVEPVNTTAEPIAAASRAAEAVVSAPAAAPRAGVDERAPVEPGGDVQPAVPPAADAGPAARADAGTAPTQEAVAVADPAAVRAALAKAYRDAPEIIKPILARQIAEHEMAQLDQATKAPTDLNPPRLMDSTPSSVSGEQQVGIAEGSPQAERVGMSHDDILADREQRQAAARGEQPAAPTTVAPSAPNSPEGRTEGSGEPPQAPPSDNGFVGSTRHAIIDQQAEDDPELAAAVAQAKKDNEPVPDAHSFAAAKDRMRDPNYATRLANDVNKGNPLRRVDPIDTVVLARERAQLNNEMAHADSAGDTKTLAALREKYINATTAARKIGTEHGRGLRFQQVIADTNLDLHHVLAMAIDAKRTRTGDHAAKLDQQEETDWRKAHADLQAKYDALAQHRPGAADQDAHTTFMGMLHEMTGEMNAANSGAGKRRPLVDILKEKADAARERLNASKGVPSKMGQSGAIDIRSLADYAIIGAHKIASKITEFGAWVKAMKDDLGDRFNLGKDDEQKAYDAAKALHDKLAAKQGNTAKAVKAPKTAEQISAKIDHANLTQKDVYDIAKAHVQAGARGLDEVMKRTHETLAKDHPEMTEREVRDMFSGYGKVKFPKQDEVHTELRSVRRLAQMQSAIDDLRNGQSALKTGLQRDKASQVIREKQRELNDALKEHQDKFGNTPEKLATYQSVRRTAYENQIDDLNKEIATGERQHERAPSPPLDKRNQDLRDARDYLVGERDRLHGEQMEGHDKAIAALQRQIDDISKPKSGVEPKPAHADTVEVAAMRERLKAMQDARAAFSKTVKAPEELEQNRIKANVTRLEKQLSDLQSGKPKAGPMHAADTAREAELKAKIAGERDKLKPPAKTDDEKRIQALKTRLQHIQEGKRSLPPMQRTETPEERDLKEQIRSAESSASLRPSPPPTRPADPNIARNNTVQKQLQRRLSQLQETARTGIFPQRGEPAPFKPDAKTTQLQKDVGRATINAFKAKNNLLKKNDGPVMSTWKKFVQGIRAVVFSSPTVAPKLMWSSVLKPVFSAVEASSVQALRLAGIGKLLAKSDYYRGGVGTFAKSEASAAYHTLGLKTLKAMVTKLGGVNDTESLAAYHLMQDPSVANPKSPNFIPGLKGLYDSLTGADANAWHDHALELPGRVHDSIKTPAEMNEYHRALVRYGDSEAIRARSTGMTPDEVRQHMNDPRTQGMIILKAYAKSQEAKFQEDNALSDAMSTAIRIGYESKSPVANIAAAAGDMATLARRVPANILADTVRYVPLLGMSEIAVRNWKRSGDEFTRADVDKTIRVLSKQPIGTALATFATLFAAGFGGMYHQGDKRKHAGDVPYDEINTGKAGLSDSLGDHEVSHFAMHQSPMHMMNVLADGVHGFHSEGDGKESYANAAAWMASDLASDIPGMKTALRWGGAVENPRTAPKVAAQTVGGWMGPLGAYARSQDSQDGVPNTRYPGKDFWPNLQAYIPGERETLPSEPPRRMPSPRRSR